jgi:hypothetical protein
LRNGYAGTEFLNTAEKKNRTERELYITRDSAVEYRVACKCNETRFVLGCGAVSGRAVPSTKRRPHTQNTANASINYGHVAPNQARLYWLEGRKYAAVVLCCTRVSVAEIMFLENGKLHLFYNRRANQ